MEPTSCRELTPIRGHSGRSTSSRPGSFHLSTCRAIIGCGSHRRTGPHRPGQNSHAGTSDRAASSAGPAHGAFSGAGLVPASMPVIAPTSAPLSTSRRAPLIRRPCQGSQRQGSQHNTGPAVMTRRGGHTRRGDPAAAQRLIAAPALAQALLEGLSGQQVRRPGAVHHLGQRPPWPGLLLFSATTATPPRWLVVLPAHRPSPRSHPRQPPSCGMFTTSPRVRRGAGVGGAAHDPSGIRPLQTDRTQ